VLEVIGEDPYADEVFVIAGLGRRANWYRNTAAGGAVEIAVARDRFAPAYREVGWPRRSRCSPTMSDATG
jgi:hypothetical protein